LMLLSNDGDFIYKVTHPSYECEKEYIGTTFDEISPKAFERVLKGGEFYGETYGAARGELAGTHTFSMILKEGHKRQIRNMLKSIRARVKTLKRVRVGCVRLESLAPGKTRQLKPAEINYFLHLKKIQKSSKISTDTISRER
jgi:pseudouridine synthase